MYLEKFKLTGKTALITGGAQGIGFEICHALLDAGASILITDINSHALEKAQSALNDLAQEKGTTIQTLVLDVSDSEAVNNAAETLSNNGTSVDILVNNAGIAISNHPAESMTDEVWRKVLQVNLDGVFYCCRAFGAQMLTRGEGVIVNMGSMSGYIVNRPQEQAQYNASKAAVHQLTKSLAAEWAERGVRVNAVAPTYIDTEMNRYVTQDKEMYRQWVDNTPMKRLGKPEEVASAVLFLSSQASSLLTGTILKTDGGYTCW
ncbi:D-arabitol dehydrogenase [Vibrio nigripulchritudo SO65]|uniref:SDR family NAD(P)-dependent oxidoreductase n=1 Tax=Vibrio nigripulchritudo TaxID=28173 RepID=UPI0003B215DB|nr:glucose 1-dehydrogenase [Vibrio nigripulchritudo]CCN36551.1 D-arabitol dehydrogenase [Vibrio nigripulchritudo AM115]CCN43635.1 D-arabitol dehydrogenase [Vibrio nigripulchritudo FTn2]CCN65332.1 D-arabitol dehydrogenase [Vibrio nigripulchritudo POn4]CCN77690.1 D-arabitol dehydrogenase [Vibrio nigripulchritudo SO65]